MTPGERASPKALAGSLVYYAQAAVTIPVWVVLLVLALPLPYGMRYPLIYSWIAVQRFCLRWLCRVRVEYEGTGNLPAGPAIVFCKHQSMLETLLTQKVMPPQTWVLKRELLRIPVFGWGLRSAAPIAIDRSSGKRALREVVRQGRTRLRQGIWVVVFPEGTRVPPGRTRSFGAGGAMLAAETEAPVVPVAHNAGEHWLRGRILIKPGIVRVRIGPAIDTAGLKPREINARAKQWIDTNTEALAARPRPCGARRGKARVGRSAGSRRAPR
ncbi:MAG TPA: lysophospholipid acyltransferase family protein [Gammaproteobacteria bacterium]|nr:lysophospholipid acyltransferase family protein [Gammaproteobacteria bacterium]